MLEEIVMSFARVSCCHCQWTRPALGEGGEEARQAPAAPAPARGGPAPRRTACLSAFFHALAPTREPGSRGGGRGRGTQPGPRGRGGETAPRVRAGRRAPEGRAATGCTPRARSLPKPGRALPAGDAAHRGPGAEGRGRGGWGREEQKTRLRPLSTTGADAEGAGVAADGQRWGAGSGDRRVLVSCTKGRLCHGRRGTPGSVGRVAQENQNSAAAPQPRPPQSSGRQCSSVGVNGR